VVVTYLKEQSRHKLGKTDENYERLSPDGLWSWSRFVRIGKHHNHMQSLQCCVVLCWQVTLFKDVHLATLSYMSNGRIMERKWPFHV